MIIFHKNPTKFVFLTAPNDYYLINTDDFIINVPIFVNEKKCPYLEKDNIKKISVKSGDDYYKVNIITMEQSLQATHEDKEYYGYDLKLELPYETNELLILKECYLNFLYENEEEINLMIGSICIYNNFIDVSLSYSNLKGYTIDYGNSKILKAVMIKLNNDSPYTIKKVIPISAYIKVDMDKTVYNKDVNLISVDDDYNLIGESINNCNIYLNGSEYVLLYLKYDEYINSEELGFIIEYEQEENTYLKVIPPFKFFKTTNSQKIVKYVHDTNC